MFIDRAIAAILPALATWVIVNGFDDLFIAGAAAYAWMRFRFAGQGRERSPTEEELDAVPQRRIAIFVCLWHEHGVIREMIEHNIRVIRYKNYDFFIGVYPNDAPTVAAATDVCNRFSNVHLSVTPHPGGTSKADNLNWIFQRMLLFEEQNNVRFEMISIHDAEDVIHPDDLRWLNYYAQWYDMVQVPVLALPTPIRHFTHGVYCDEFAEFQFKDLPAREVLGGFLPSCGVGTGFSRRALESVATACSNQIFDATSLTEDYEIGFRIHRLGYPQKFIRVMRRDGKFVATREFFASKLAKAVAQRSRWVTGIALQSWEKHGVRDTLSQLYWFWRDRKGLISNLLTPLTNGIFFYGAITWLFAVIRHDHWWFGEELTMSWVAKANWWPVLLLVPQAAIRMCCSAAVYGWRFALFVPLRVPWANFVNCCASVKAIKSFLSCKVRGVPLRWLKTEHAYPSRAALITQRRNLGDILIELKYISAQALDAALFAQPPGVQVGDYLVQLKLLTGDQLCHALGLQHDLPIGKPRADQISAEVTRAIPADIARQLKVLPFRVVAGQLYFASIDPPDETRLTALRQFWPSEMRFQLVSPQAFQDLTDQYLPPLSTPSIQFFLTGIGLMTSLFAISRAWLLKSKTSSSAASGA